MTLFRVRRYGSSDWIEVSVRNAAEEDENEIEDEISKLVGSVLVVDDLHCQFMNDEGEWEDLE